MVMLAWAYLVWLNLSHPEVIIYKFKNDCEQARRIDIIEHKPVSKCFKKDDIEV